MLTSTTTRVTVRLPTLARTFRKTGGRTVSTVTRASSTETVRSDTRRDADPAWQARASVDAPRATHDPRLASRRARTRGGRRRAFRVSLSSRDTIRLRRSFSFVREVGSRPLSSRLPPSPGRTGRPLGGPGLMSPSLLSPFGASLTSPLSDMEYEMQRMMNGTSPVSFPLLSLAAFGRFAPRPPHRLTALFVPRRRFVPPELVSMRDAVFGHRDTVGRIPDKLDFNCDVLEKKGEFQITADLPGLAKDQVNITVDDDRRLHITAERAARHEEVRNAGTFLVFEAHPEVPVRDRAEGRRRTTRRRKRIHLAPDPEPHLESYPDPISSPLPTPTPTAFPSRRRPR